MEALSYHYKRFNSVNYEAWLNTLEINQIVLLQEFLTPNSLYGFDIEMWSLQRVKFYGNTVVKFYGNTVNGEGSHKPLNPKTGETTYWGNDTPTGNIFSNRIVPIPNNPTFNNQLFSTYPVWEPNFFTGYRHFFLVHPERGYLKNADEIRREFDQKYYSLKVVGGELFVVFSSVDPDNIENPHYLYSQKMQ